VKKLQQKLEKAAQEQKDLKKTFENFLEQQAEKKKLAQEAAEGKPVDGKDASKSKGQSGAKGQNGTKGQGAGKGESPSDSDSAVGKQSAAESKGTGKPRPSWGAGKGQGIGKSGIASAEKILKMLQAKQRALGEEVSQLKQDLKQLPKISEGGEGQGRDEAQKHLDEAVTKMGDFDTKLTEARYGADIEKGKSTEAVGLLESAKRELDLARKALDAELVLNDEQSIAQKAREMAEQLAEDADALDESVTTIEREQMLARLEAAKRLLESMARPQVATISKSNGSPGSGHVFTKNPNIAPAIVARAMARQFWSIAINAKRHKAQLIEDQPSDVKFYQLETKFFENAAKFNKKPVQK